MHGKHRVTGGDDVLAGQQWPGLGNQRAAIGAGQQVAFGGLARIAQGEPQQETVELRIR